MKVGDRVVVDDHDGLRGVRWYGVVRRVTATQFTVFSDDNRVVRFMLRTGKEVGVCGQHAARASLDATQEWLKVAEASGLAEAKKRATRAIESCTNFEHVLYVCHLTEGINRT